MRGYGWTLQSSLWFVFLVALGLKVAITTWSNLKRGSIEYHRYLAHRSEILSARHQRRATLLEDESNSRSISDPAIAADKHEGAILWAESARSYSLLTTSLAKKTELCKQSFVGWIFLFCETTRNPPDFPVQHSSGHDTEPWLKRGTPAYFVIVTLAHVDYFGLACLALAIVVRRRFVRDRGVGGRPPAPTAS